MDSKNDLTTLKVMSTKNVMDIRGGSYDDGAGICQYQEHGGLHQFFKFEKEGEYYAIKSAKSGKALDVGGYGTENGTLVVQWTFHGGDNQLWLPEIWDEDSKFIISRESILGNI